MRFDLQISPAVVSWQHLSEATIAADEAGFDAVWVFDHFLGAAISGTHMLEPFALLGALSMTTSRIRLGSLVLNVANRSAPVIANGAATVQTLSGGRFLLGLGAGASPASPWAREQRALRLPVAPTLAERHARLVETLDVLERVWSPQREPEVATIAVPAPLPPIVLGVNSVPLARIAGSRCDGMNVRSRHPALDELVEVARDARDESGRVGEFDLSVWAVWEEALFDPDHRERRRWESLGVNRVILVWFDPVDIDALRRAATHLAS